MFCNYLYGVKLLGPDYAKLTDPMRSHRLVMCCHLREHDLKEPYEIFSILHVTRVNLLFLHRLQHRGRHSAPVPTPRQRTTKSGERTPLDANDSIAC